VVDTDVDVNFLDSAFVHTLRLFDAESSSCRSCFHLDFVDWIRERDSHGWLDEE
jgi:hypothetical protein